MYIAAIVSTLVAWALGLVLDANIQFGDPQGFLCLRVLLPVLAMGYLSTSVMADIGTARLGQVLALHGWSWQTAVCAAVLCLMHLPCGTTCLTLLKETGSKKWTLVGMLLPLSMGILLCCMLHGLFCIFA